MKLSSDLKSPWLIHTKGVLFLVAGLMAAGLVLVEAPTLKVTGLLAVTVWAFCRFYYYLFYVLERYLGRGKPFSGILDALGSLFRSRRGEKEKPGGE